MNNAASSNSGAAEPVRVVIVGAGAFGALHAQAFACNPDCTLVAIVDHDTERARSVAALVGNVAAYGSFDEAVAAERFDAVSVATAGEYHLEVSTAALDAGKHVLLEKPVVMTTAEGKLLRAAAVRADRIVMPAHLLRFASSYKELHASVTSGAIGRPRALSFRRHRTIAHDTLFPTVHPVLMTMIHDIDLALWLTNAIPAHISARQVEQAGRAQPLAVWAEVVTTQGAVLSFQVSWSLATGDLPDALEVVGETGTLALTLSPRIHSFSAMTGPIDDALTPAASQGALQEEIRAFIDALRLDIPSPGATLTEALAGIDLAERIISEALAHRIEQPA